jgi:hypothetical protein
MGILARDILFMKDRRTKRENSYRTLGHPIRPAFNGKRKRIKSSHR